MCGGAFNRGIDGGVLTFSNTNGGIYAYVSFRFITKINLFFKLINILTEYYFRNFRF